MNTPRCPYWEEMHGKVQAGSGNQGLESGAFTPGQSKEGRAKSVSSLQCL
jgi:hypothetical protein